MYQCNTEFMKACNSHIFYKMLNMYVFLKSACDPLTRKFEEIFKHTCQIERYKKNSIKIKVLKNKMI